MTLQISSPFSGKFSENSYLYSTKCIQSKKHPIIGLLSRSNFSVIVSVWGSVLDPHWN